MSETKLYITWEAEDGYVGGRPQTTGFSLSDFEDDMDLSQIKDQIEVAIQDDFEQKISPSYSNDDVDDLAVRVLVALAKVKA